MFPDCNIVEAVNFMTKQKTWEIRNGQLPDDLRRYLEEIIEQSEGAWKKRVSDNSVLPPWEEFPNYGRTSLGWRMGSGEDYRINFRCWFLELDAQARLDFQVRFPEPGEWHGFYADLLSSL